ncbi:MAG: hypothetical protein ACXAAM_07520, partial [Candidatus Heimdallarchaeaceae archaeon]
MNVQNVAFLEIKLELLEKEKVTKKDLSQIKRTVSKKYKLEKFPRNSDILAVCSEEERELL